MYIPISFKIYKNLNFGVVSSEEDSSAYDNIARLRLVQEADNILQLQQNYKVAYLLNEDELVASCQLVDCENSEVIIHNFLVGNVFIGLNMGSQFLKQILHYLKEQNIMNIYTSYNESSVAFWAKWGFQLTKQTKQIQNQSIDCLRFFDKQSD